MSTMSVKSLGTSPVICAIDELQNLIPMRPSSEAQGEKDKGKYFG